LQIIQELQLDNDNIVFQPNIGNSYQLNDVARDIVLLLQQQKTKSQIVKTISNEYDVSPETLYIDVSDFISKLKTYGLVV
jgi:hypothetical protein